VTAAPARPPQVVLPVGGRGTRLRPLTDRVPKCLAPVHGRPFLSYVLTALRDQGVRDVVLCSGYRSELVVEAIGDGARWGLRVRHSVETAPLAAVGALRHAQALLADEFVVLYGDVYPRVPVARVVERFEAVPQPATMVVVPDEGGNAVVSDGMVTDYDKYAGDGAHRWLDAGLLALEKRVLLEDDAADEAGFYGRLAREGKLAALEVEADLRPFEIGCLDGYREFCAAVPDGAAVCR
jgi:MurNAc alpha-1-phosphate uridylyltransferase